MQAIIEVEPFSVLELVVGAGGGAGVNGTELETVDIEEQRRRMAIRRDIEIHLPKGEKMVHRDDDEHAVNVLNEEVCGVTLGGAPGGEYFFNFCFFSPESSLVNQQKYIFSTSHMRFRQVATDTVALGAGRAAGAGGTPSSTSAPPRAARRCSWRPEEAAEPPSTDW